MHYYHRRYMQPPCPDPNNEVNPEYESNYEMENFENETSGESESEYDLNPEFSNEQNFESGNILGIRRGVQNVHGIYHPNSPRSFISSARYGYPNRGGSVYRAPGLYGGNASLYRRAPFYGHGLPYNNYNRYGNFPWNRWHHRYPGSSYNYGMPDTDQSASYPQDAGAPPTVSSGGNLPNSIMDTINNLAQQVAATNANVQAIQSALSNPGNAGPSAMPPPDSGMPPAGGPVPPGPAKTPEIGREMEDYEYEMENEMYDSGHEMNEMELATELLSTNNEMELDHFLGGILGSLGGPLKNLLGGVIKKALPIAGAAAGTFFGGPLGTAIGGQIGSAASNLFELELEGLSNEDQEFEVARAIIRLITEAAATLANGPHTGDLNEDAKNALIHAATLHAPGLLVKKHHHHHHGEHGHHHHGEHGHGGHWHRRGNKIVIENAF